MEQDGVTECGRFGSGKIVLAGPPAAGRIWMTESGEPLRPGESKVYAIQSPSGDHTGSSASLPSFPVKSLRGASPLSPPTQTSRANLPDSPLTKAIDFPSGEMAG